MSSWVLTPRAISPLGSPSSARKPARTSSAFANARPHFSSTSRAASSKASTWPSSATSGHAWWECPVSSSRSATRKRE